MENDKKQLIVGNRNNQAGRDIHYNDFLGYLKIDPKQIELEAVVNNWLITTLIATVYSILMIFIFSYFNGSFFAKLVGITLALVFFFFMSYGIDKYIYTLPKWHVKYKDGTIIINGIERKFYSEIWDMEYKTSWWFGQKKGHIIIYGVNEVKNKPYVIDLKFMFPHHAKYVYDSFWSKSRIEEFENNRKLDA